MDWSGAITPLVIAAIGVIAVAIGSWVAARSALRVRLIDFEREDARAHRDFMIRVVAAVNALNTASAHLVRARLAYLRAPQDEARARLEASGVAMSPSTGGWQRVSPDEDARVAVATAEWRGVLAEGHAFASGDTGPALEAFDERRAALATAINNAMDLPSVPEIIRGLEAADTACEELRLHYARQLVRNLHIEKIAGSGRVFQIAHTRRLRTFAKKISAMHHADIVEARSLIARAAREHEARQS